jgi:hypothetical protein
MVTNPFLCVWKLWLLLCCCVVVEIVAFFLLSGKSCDRIRGEQKRGRATHAFNPFRFQKNPSPAKAEYLSMFGNGIELWITSY